jgi:hypothetical protein
MITAFVVIDALMERQGARVPDAEIVMIAVVATNSDRIKKNLHSRCCTGWRAKKYPRIPEKALVLNSWIYRPATATALCRRPAPLSGSQRTSLLIPLAMVRALPLEPCASSHSIRCFIKHPGACLSVSMALVLCHFPRLTVAPRHPDTCGKRRLRHRIIDPFVNVQLSFSFPGVLAA